MRPFALVNTTEVSCIDTIPKLHPKKKSALGQFMTSDSISKFLASLFDDFSGDDINLLDPGAGTGALTVAFIEEYIRRPHRPKSINVTAYEIEPIFRDYLASAFLTSRKICTQYDIKLVANIKSLDFIQDGVSKLAKNYNNGLCTDEMYTHIIMNPPYKKIHSDSSHRKWLRSIGIETSNLYSGFLAIAIKLLRPGGELVAIVPRSFCNGPYFKSFRNLLLGETTLRHLHVFESRSHAFKGDSVLQENIIFRVVKGESDGNVKITASNGATFFTDEGSGDVITEDMTQRIVPYSSIIKPDDPDKFIHIATTDLHQRIIEKISVFNNTLEDLGIKVSTGPVVDFRMKDDLIQNPEPGDMPLLYPVHFKDRQLEWPKKTKKPNAIRVSTLSKKCLWPNTKSYVITRRFTSKEEKRRIVAAVYDSSLPGELVGFENHLNVFHKNRMGLPNTIAQGLALYLNSTLLDRYFRQFNGHTQVNATDLRSLRYPNYDALKRLGEQTGTTMPPQREIDDLIDEEIKFMADSPGIDPICAQKKIEEALLIVKALGLPRGQHNERSALTLLALLNQKPENSWKDAESPLIGITPIMEFCSKFYGKEYAPNSRETFRRQTMHQFVDAAIAIYNPDKPDRPVNSPKACYQISPGALKVIITFGTNKWDVPLSIYLKQKKTLVQQYAKEREMQMIPVKVSKGHEIKLTPGTHSQLIKDIIQEFAPRFAPDCEIIYIGDTGDKIGYFERERLRELGVDVDKHGKMPDVVLYYSKKDWLLLIESVTSHGPVDSKRHNELSTLFKSAKPGLVYVTAFQNRRIMAKYVTEISWETEVWVAESPTHLIHFNGDKFLGPWKG